MKEVEQIQPSERNVPLTNSSFLQGLHNQEGFDYKANAADSSLILMDDSILFIKATDQGSQNNNLNDLLDQLK